MSRKKMKMRAPWTNRETLSRFHNFYIVFLLLLVLNMASYLFGWINRYQEDFISQPESYIWYWIWSIQQWIRILFPPISNGVSFHFLDDNHLVRVRWKLSVVSCLHFPGGRACWRLFVHVFMVLVFVHLESIYSVHLPIWLDYLLFSLFLYIWNLSLH